MIETKRPLVTFALFAYNHEKYIREAVQGALAQTYSPLEIILSDDCSVDGTFQIMQEMASNYKGTHKIILNQNATNRGVIKHIDAVITLATGDLIVVAAGDDISDSQRVSVIVEEFRLSSRKYVAIYSALTPIDDRSSELESNEWQHGEPADAIEMITRRGGIYGCSAAYSRDLFAAFGPIDADVFHEDQVLPFRAAICGEIRFTRSRMVRYRVHQANLWARHRTFSSKKEYINRREKFLRNDVGVARQQIVDLEHAKLIAFEPNINFTEIQRLLQSNLARASLELNLVNTTNHFIAMILIFKLLFNASSFRRGILWIYLRFSPEIKWLNSVILR